MLKSCTLSTEYGICLPVVKKKSAVRRIDDVFATTPGEMEYFTVLKILKHNRFPRLIAQRGVFA
jgi:hypothetical protein